MLTFEEKTYPTNNSFNERMYFKVRGSVFCGRFYTIGPDCGVKGR